MADDQAQSKEEHKDFFISYTSADRRWAEWIAWHLDRPRQSFGNSGVQEGLQKDRACPCALSA